jgi:hypothetical protein
METVMSGLDEGFRIDSAEKAAWAMRKYRRLAQQEESNKRLAASEMARIDDWVTRVNASVCSEMEFFAAHLEAYAVGQRAQGKKSIDLPDGVIKTRSQAASVTIDKSTFIQWAVEAKREDLLRVTYAPNMDAIKSTTVIDQGNVIDVATGEIIPGAEPSPERVTVSIAPDLEAIDLEGIDDETE